MYPFVLIVLKADLVEDIALSKTVFSYRTSKSSAIAQYAVSR